MNKHILIITLTTLVLACGGNPGNQKVAGNQGQEIYKKYCLACHGVDGKLGLNGSKDITVSLLTEAERAEQIRVGKNTMTPFEGILSPAEIKAVAAYTMTLTKQ